MLPPPHIPSTALNPLAAFSHSVHLVHCHETAATFFEYILLHEIALCF